MNCEYEHIAISVDIESILARPHCTTQSETIIFVDRTKRTVLLEKTLDAAVARHKYVLVMQLQTANMLELTNADAR